MSGYKHGVYILERPTALLPPRRIAAGLPVVVGTAPVHTVAGPVNQPRLIYGYREFVETFGFDQDFGAYTLCEFARVFFTLYNLAPAVFINVLDPARHRGTVSEAEKTFVEGRITLEHTYPQEPALTSQDGATTYQEGTDYTLDAAEGVVTRLESGAIGAGDTVKVSYHYVDPAAVTPDEVIGGVDADTGVKSGLELVSEVFPRFRLVPGQIVAPGWSQYPAVAAVMAAKAEGINGCFKAVAVVDVPVAGEGAPGLYSQVPAWTQEHNYTDRQMVVCWPKVTLGGAEHWLSSHLAGLMCRTDSEHGDVPHKSPSNEPLVVDGVAPVAGREVWLGPEEGAYLNGQGVVTALNFDGGWKAWGNRTGAYPGSSEVKDTFLPIRRMFNWVGNTLVLTWWQRLDFPVTRRAIETMVDSANVWLNGLAAREIILGGRVEFRADENPVSEVMDGVVRLHVYLTPPSPARELDFILEYDPAYLQSLFNA